MKLIKLKEIYDHYVIITDEEIKVDDIVLETRVDGFKVLEHIQTLNDIDPSTQKKVTHTSIPIVGLCLIDEDELKELLGDVDVEKKAEERYPTYDGDLLGIAYNQKHSRLDYIAGYNQAFEDNKGKIKNILMEYDLMVKKHLLMYSIEHSIHGKICEGLSVVRNEYIQSLQPPTSWDVEFVNGKLKLV